MKNKKILITGTSSGIGKYLANKFLKDNEVIGLSRTSTIEHQNYTHINHDIAEDIGTVLDKVNDIDVLINCAGIAKMGPSITYMKSEINQIMRVNFVGAVNITQVIAKKMMLRRKGNIINISSIVCHDYIPGESLYAASKSALETFMIVAAKELGKYNIKINNLVLPPVDTKLLKGVDKNKIDDIINNQFIPRSCTFEDIFEEVLHLSKTNFLTGQNIRLGSA